MEWLGAIKAPFLSTTPRQVEILGGSGSAIEVRSEQRI